MHHQSTVRRCCVPLPRWWSSKSAYTATAVCRVRTLIGSPSTTGLDHSIVNESNTLTCACGCGWFFAIDTHGERRKEGVRGTCTSTEGLPSRASSSPRRAQSRGRQRGGLYFRKLTPESLTIDFRIPTTSGRGDVQGSRWPRKRLTWMMTALLSHPCVAAPNRTYSSMHQREASIAPLNGAAEPQLSQSYC